MRKIVLSPNDFDLFNTDITFVEFEFMHKHWDAFRRMWKEQGRKFWIRFVVTYRNFATDSGSIQDISNANHKYQSLVDEVFIFLHENFIDGKYRDAKNLLQELLILSQHRGMIQFLNSKSYAKDPFFNRETRDCFRHLFGPPTEKISYVKVCVLHDLLIKFGGAVMRCLKRWLDADEIASDEDTNWDPMNGATSAPDGSDYEEDGDLCGYCCYVVGEEPKRSYNDSAFITYQLEKSEGMPCGPWLLEGWKLHKDPRFTDTGNPLYDLSQDPQTDWRTDLTYEKFAEFMEHVRVKYPVAGDEDREVSTKNDATVIRLWERMKAEGVDEKGVLVGLYYVKNIGDKFLIPLIKVYKDMTKEENGLSEETGPVDGKDQSSDPDETSNAEPKIDVQRVSKSGTEEDGAVDEKIKSEIMKLFGEGRNYNNKIKKSIATNTSECGLGASPEDRCLDPDGMISTIMGSPLDKLVPGNGPTVWKGKLKWEEVGNARILHTVKCEMSLQNNDQQLNTHDWPTELEVLRFLPQLIMKPLVPLLTDQAILDLKLGRSHDNVTPGERLKDSMAGGFMGCVCFPANSAGTVLVMMIFYLEKQELIKIVLPTDPFSVLKGLEDIMTEIVQLQESQNKSGNKPIVSVKVNKKKKKTKKVKNTIGDVIKDLEAAEELENNRIMKVSASGGKAPEKVKKVEERGQPSETKKIDWASGIDKSEHFAKMSNPPVNIVNADGAPNQSPMSTNEMLAIKKAFTEELNKDPNQPKMEIVGMFPSGTLPKLLQAGQNNAPKPKKTKAKKSTTGSKSVPLIPVDFGDDSTEPAITLGRSSLESFSIPSNKPGETLTLVKGPSIQVGSSPPSGQTLSPREFEDRKKLVIGALFGDKMNRLFERAEAGDIFAKMKIDRVLMGGESLSDVEDDGNIEKKCSDDGTSPGIETDTIHILNLPVDVNNREIAEYFSQAGQIKYNIEKQAPYIFIHSLEKHGICEAKVCYVNRGNSQRAVDLFHEKEWKGKVLKVELDPLALIPGKGVPDCIGVDLPRAMFPATNVRPAAKYVLKICSGCKKNETIPQTFKKCQKCKELKVTTPRYYCGRDCQVADWKAQHKMEHKEDRLPCTIQT